MLSYGLKLPIIVWNFEGNPNEYTSVKSYFEKIFEIETDKFWMR